MVSCLLSREIIAAFLNQSCQAVRTNSLFRSWPQSFPVSLGASSRQRQGRGDWTSRRPAALWHLDTWGGGRWLVGQVKGHLCLIKIHPNLLQRSAVEGKRLPEFFPPSPNAGDPVPGCDLEKSLFQGLGRELNWLIPKALKKPVIPIPVYPCGLQGMWGHAGEPSLWPH